MAKQSITEKLKTQANEVWTNYGWILIISNMLFGLAFLYMVLRKKEWVMDETKVESRLAVVK